MASYGTVPDMESAKPSVGGASSSSTESGGRREELLTGAPAKPQDATNSLLEDPEFLAAKRKTEQLVKFTKLVVPFFGLIAVFSFLGMIIGLVGAVPKSTMVWEMLLLNFVGASFGAWGVWKWGTVEEEIDRLRGENNKYEAEILQLQSTKKKLQGEVEGIQSSVDGLQGSVDELNEQMSGFDELRKELESIAGDNQEIADVLGETSQIFADMRVSAVQNEKAALLNLYYDVAFRDGDDGMSKSEYKRFLGRLSKKQRKFFNTLGSFEELAGADGIIDLSEFQEIVERLLASIEQELVKGAFDDHDAKSK